MMKITVLGSGSSGGVPLIGCSCSVCSSHDPKDKRTRTSLYIEYKDTKILIDASPDLRQQALRENITYVDTILFTHAHADHIHGIDEVRAFNRVADKSIDIYTNYATLEEIKQRFDYVFLEPIKEYGWFRPSLIPHLIEEESVFHINQDIEVHSFPQFHGVSNTLGFRIDNFAYSTDTNQIDAKYLEQLKGIDLWVVDCLCYNAAPTHAHLDLALEWIEKVKPKKAVLIHMGHHISYAEITNKIKDYPNIEAAYDGMKITC